MSPKRRGASKQANWRRDPDAATAVIALELDCTAPQTRGWVEKMFAAAFQLRRAVQSTARSRQDAYWASHHLRQIDAKAAREHFGLNRARLEAAAYRHLDESVWMRQHLTKALAMHLADQVWATCERNLFRDDAGNRQGRVRIGQWFDFTRIPGRARSHTKQRTWETFRLVGSLEAHSAAYRPTRNAPPRSAITQPARLSAPVKPRGGWWNYDGPLAVVFTGLPAGDLVLPVRLPQGLGQWARIEHFLADPSAWHKIDLVRVQDFRASGGWRYYAHLMVLKSGWTSPARAAARETVRATAGERLAGVDANVSNVAVVSFAPRTGAVDQRLHARDLRADHLSVTPAQRAAAARAAQQAAARARKLERSRRVANAQQYAPSPGQAQRAARREARGLTARTVHLPKGARVAGTNGIPRQAYRRDTLTPAYRTIRAKHGEAARGQVRARDARARDVAERIVARHGARLVIEDLAMSAWVRRWGKAMGLFTPGRLIAALEAETTACGGGLARVSARTTALSQTCPCLARVKKPLAQRVHACACGIHGDRDLVSAAMGACVTLTNPTDPASAAVDPTLAGALARLLAGQQEALVRSTTPRPPRPRRGSRRSVNVAVPRRGVASAGRAGETCETPDETPPTGTTRDCADDERQLVTSPVLSHAALRLSS